MAAADITLANVSLAAAPANQDAATGVPTYQAGQDMGDNGTVRLTLDVTARVAADAGNTGGLLATWIETSADDSPGSYRSIHRFADMKQEHTQERVSLACDRFLRAAHIIRGPSKFSWTISGRSC